MSVKSVPLNSDKAMQKDIFRFAATLFSEENDVYSTVDSQLQMIKCIFFEKKNAYLPLDEISNELLNNYKYHISKDETLSIVRRHKKVFIRLNDDGIDLYKLTDVAYSETVELQEKNIDYYISQFIEFYKISDSKKCLESIHSYLYELTTTNINSYKLLIYGKDNSKFKSSELSVDVNFLDDEGLKYVHDFIDWDNGEKNIALSNIVFSCLEYCMLVNGDKPNKLLVNSIRKREIYVDTNILFRAIGINGKSRQKVVVAFLKKCVQAKLKIIISHNTKKEFFDTVDYYISQILKYPRGNTFTGAYELLTDYTLFSFYDDWRNEHPILSIRYFKMYIQSLYSKVVDDYGIIDDEKIPKAIYDSDEFKECRNKYSFSIKNKKRELKSIYVAEDDHYSLKDSHDATVIGYVEFLRDKAEANKDIFFVSSDKLLRYWDMDRKDREYPIVIYPSQLFLILIKTCGRSENDFESFVSFINIKPTHRQITPEKANIILSGISSITEDLEAQRLIASAICGDAYQDVVKTSNADSEFYEKVKLFSQKYLEDELKAREEKIKEIERQNEINESSIGSLKSTVNYQENIIKKDNDKIEEINSAMEKQKEQISAFAEKKIMPKLIFNRYGVLAIAIVLTFFTLTFFALQFFFKNQSWNFAILFFDRIKTTWFGENVGDFVYVVDSIPIAIVGYIWRVVSKKLSMNKDDYKAQLVEKYISRNKLK